MRTALLVIHLAIAATVLAVLGRQYLAAAASASEARGLAGRDHAETSHLVTEIERMKALREGLQRTDPFVVELIARDRLRFTGPGEFTPPKMPRVDTSERPGR